MVPKPVKYCVVDAFTDSPFKGNPAAVCYLEEKREEEWLQGVAREFNLSETCYLTRITPHPESCDSPRFRLRWFTPVTEVELCGHATLAASHFLFTSGLVNSDVIEFLTLSGVLTAKKALESESLDYFIELDFPVAPLTDFDSDDLSAISKSLNGAHVVEIKKTTTSQDLLVVLPSGKEVVDIEPHFKEIQECPGNGMIVTGLAPSGSGFDFYSRYFCPTFGINEDPVTGSAHCSLVSYWCKRLGKSDVVAYQASSRGGVIKLHLDEKNQRVLLKGKAVTVMEGLLLA